MEKTLHGHKSRINQCSASELNYIMSCSEDKTYKIWDVNSFTEILTISPKFSIFSAVMFNDKFHEINNENVIVLSSSSNTEDPIMFYDIQGFKIKELVNPEEKKHFCYTLSYFHSQKNRKTYLFAGYGNSNVVLFDIKTNEVVKKYNNSGPIYSIVANLENSDEEWLYFSSHDGYLKKVMISDETKIVDCYLKSSVNDICIWNSEYLLCSLNDGTIRVFRLDTLTEVLVHEKVHNSYVVNLIKISDDYNQTTSLLTLGFDGNIKMLKNFSC